MKKNQNFFLLEKVLFLFFGFSKKSILYPYFSTFIHFCTIMELILPESPNYISLISGVLTFRPSQVDAVLTLTAEGSTVPFIARYRQERTG